MTICTVSRTAADGTIVRWYRSVLCAEQDAPMAVASRYWATIHDLGAPAEVAESALRAHEILAVDSDADLTGWATHRREPQQAFGRRLIVVVPVDADR